MHTTDMTSNAGYRDRARAGYRDWARHGASLIIAVLLIGNVGAAIGAEGGSRISAETIPFLPEEAYPKATPPLLEIGDPFLANGNLNPGFTLPTGAVWQPRFWVFGSARSALQTFDSGPGGDVTEWMNRLDLFGNLQLTGTERILIGIQPLQRNGKFTGQVFDSDGDNGFRNELNLGVRTLFFEGDIAEIFPNLDLEDAAGRDYGFSVGRQALVFQDGLLINDTMDSLGITRNSVRFEGVSWLANLRITALWAWNEVNRDDNVDDPDAHLFGIFTALDTTLSTIEIDAVYVDSDDRGGGDLFVAGVGAIQRFGLINTSLRVVGSVAVDEKTAQSDDGLLIFGEVSWTPYHTNSVAYVNGFWGIENFSSAARDSTAGGPLGRTGILFAARGLGSFPSPLNNRADDAFGLAVGYQMFFDGIRRQLILETGGRRGYGPGGFDAVGIAARLQQAVGRRAILQLDGFAAAQSDRSPGYGIRAEVLIKF